MCRYCEHFETAAQTLINQTLDLDEFQAIIDQALAHDPTDTTVGARAAGIRDRRNTTLRDLFTDADTQHRDPRHPLGRAAGHHRIPRPPHPRQGRRRPGGTGCSPRHALAERKQRAYDLLATR